MDVRVDVCSVLRAVQLVEAYVPGLRDMPAVRYNAIAHALLEALEVPTDGALVALIPVDEVMLVLVAQPHLPIKRTKSELSVIVQRVVDAWVDGPYDAVET